MALNWTDKQDNIDDILAEDINAIAHGVLNNETAIGNKVDKEDGKGLSTNDYTDADKGKVSLIGESFLIWEEEYPSATNQYRFMLDGQGFPKKGAIVINVPAEGCPSSAAITIGVTTEPDVGTASEWVSLAVGQQIRTVADTAYRMVAEFEDYVDGVITRYGGYGSNAFYSAMYSSFSDVATADVKGVRVTSTAALPAGTTIKIYERN